MTVTLLLYTVVFLVGVAGGCTGVGGVIIVPLLLYLTGMTSHVAMGTTLFSFMFTAGLSALLYARKGDIDWGMSGLLLLGAVPCSYGGAQVKAMLGGDILNLILATVILAASWFALRPVNSQGLACMVKGHPLRIPMLMGVGAMSGTVTGLTGVGGGALSIALLMLLGIPPLTVVGVAQAFGFPSAVAGTIGNIQHGAVDYSMGLTLAVLQVLGLLWGVRLAHIMDTAKLRLLVVGLCISTGLFIFATSLRPFLPPSFLSFLQ